jgi:hypothetical protein
MAVKKFTYDGNKSVYNSTSVLEVGNYAATQGQVLPISQKDYAVLIPHFVLKETDAEITATKISDQNDLSEVIENATPDPTPQLVSADPEGTASSSSDGSLKGGTGSGGGK